MNTKWTRGLILTISGLMSAFIFAETPQWWMDHDVIDTNAQPCDYAAVRQRQQITVSSSSREKDGWYNSNPRGTCCA